MPKDTENYINLRSFFNDEYQSLKAYAKSRIDDAADRDAEDIVQDVALQIFARADNLSPINNIAGFVYHSIRNKIIDVMRAKKNEISLENTIERRLTEFTELLYGKSDNSYSEKMKIELKQAIFNLKSYYQDIIIAIDFEGYSYTELSIETGIPTGTLMSRRHRALSILFKKLELKRERIN
jgi:RNA polymerase sigma-70 factor (ECF subfamily)